MDEERKASTLPSHDVRQCSMCQRTVTTSEGAYVGGGRWCCFSCAAALYSDDDDDTAED